MRARVRTKCDAEDPRREHAVFFGSRRPRRSPDDSWRWSALAVWTLLDPSFHWTSDKFFSNFFSFAKTVAKCVSIRLHARLFVRLFAVGKRFLKTCATVGPGRCSIKHVRVCGQQMKSSLNDQETVRRLVELRAAGRGFAHIATELSTRCLCDLDGSWHRQVLLEMKNGIEMVKKW